MLRGEGVAPDAWIWVHAHAVPEAAALRRAAEAGAWISLDGLGEGTAAHILGLLLRLREWGLLGRALVSHDGEAMDSNGGSRQFHELMTSFIPLMERSGFGRSEVEQVTVRNPAQAFAVGVRARR
jgi:phosphotriesterase-related protein